MLFLYKEIGKVSSYKTATSMSVKNYFIPVNKTIKLRFENKNVGLNMKIVF